MPASYFGLICPACNAGYPLGKENKRDWRYGITDLPFQLPGPWELSCIRCGAVTRFEQLLTWEPKEGYTAAQMAVAALRIQRVRAAETQP